MQTMPDTTFFSSPAAEQPQRGKVALIGVPFDGLSTERSGSADAPGALRRASNGIGRYRVSTAKAIDWPACCVDLGDVAINRFEPSSSFEPVHQAVQACLAVGAMPLLVGGDHGLTYPAVTAAAQSHAGLRLVQVDAHHDATDPVLWHCRYNHGTFVRNLITDGMLTGSRIYQVGVRDFQWHESGAAFLRDHATHIFSMDRIDQHGFEPLLSALRSEPDEPVWLSVDIDSLDPAYAPGTGEHMCGGLSSREAMGLLRELFDGSLNIVAADLVEVAPQFDISGRTVSLASQMLALMVDGLARSGGARLTLTANDQEAP